MERCRVLARLGLISPRALGDITVKGFSTVFYVQPISNASPVYNVQHLAFSSFFSFLITRKEIEPERAQSERHSPTLSSQLEILSFFVFRPDIHSFYNVRTFGFVSFTTFPTSLPGFAVRRPRKRAKQLLVMFPVLSLAAQ